MAAFPLKMNAKTIGIGIGALVGVGLIYKLAFHKSHKAATDSSSSGDAAALSQIQQQLAQENATLATAAQQPAPGYGAPYAPAYGTPYATSGYPATTYAQPGTTQTSGPPATPPTPGYQWVWGGFAWNQVPAATPVGMHWQQLGTAFNLAPNVSNVAYIDRRPANPASIIPTTVLTPAN